MKSGSIRIILFLAIMVSGCHGKQTPEETGQPDVLFPKGEKIISENFSGTVWLKMLLNNDTVYNTSIGLVTFEPGARTNWHIHPGGQILLVSDGEGFYQEKGKPARVLRKGEIVKIPPQIEHWHGASPENGLTHIAISLNLEKGSVIWLQPVTDEEYKNLGQAIKE